MSNHVQALLLGLTISFLATQGSFAFSKPEDPAKKIESIAASNPDEITYMTIVKFNSKTGDTTTNVIQPDTLDEATKAKIIAHANMVSGDGKKPAGSPATLGAFDSFLRKAGRVVKVYNDGGDWTGTLGDQVAKAARDIARSQGGVNIPAPRTEKPSEPAVTNPNQSLPVTPVAPTMGESAGAAVQLPPSPPAMPNTGAVAPTQLPPPPPPMSGSSGAVNVPSQLPPPPPPMTAPAASAGAEVSKAPSGLLGQIQQGTMLKPVQGNLSGNKRPAEPDDLAGSLADQIAKRAKAMNPDAPQPMDVDPNSDWE